MRALDPLRGVRARPGRISVLLSVGLATAIITLAACQRDDAPSSVAGPQPTATIEVPTPEAVVIAAPRDPGAGLVQGRLIDAMSGLPVAGAVVHLQSHGRRLESGPDGRFRFDGVEPGPVSLRVLPPDDHLPRAFVETAASGGLDIGLVALAPAEKAALVVPEYGGVATGCGPTQLAIATDVLRKPVELRVTCVPDTGPFPAAPPSDRLPVSVVHLSPANLALAQPALLTIALPIEPRFRGGTRLDLLRLDFDTLRWTPAGAVEVAPGGSAAQGTVDRLGTFLVAAPPFGSADLITAPGPTVAGIHATDRAGGHLVERFDPGIALVYVAFDYRGMNNTLVRVVTTDGAGAVVASAQRPYVAEGHDDVPIAMSGGWPDGAYVSEVQVDGKVEGTVEWLVAGLSPLPAQGDSGSGVSGACLPPTGWYPHAIRTGDTLFALAAGQGLSVEQLQDANCLSGETIFAGQTLYLPAPLVRPPSRWTPLPGRAPLPNPYPRIWYPPGPPTRPQPPLPGGGRPAPAEPTLAPRPTLPPLP